MVLTAYEMATELVHGAYRMFNSGNISMAEDYLDQLDHVRDQLTPEEKEAINKIAFQLAEHSMT